MQTSRPACAALRSMLPNILAPVTAAASGAEPQPLPDLTDIDMDAEPVPFEGDYFGEYGPNDFDDTLVSEGPAAHDSDSDDSDSDDEVAYGLGWEPEPRAAPAPQPVSSTDAESTRGPPIPSRPQRTAIEESVKRKTYVVPYPSKHAGAALRRGSIPEAAATASTYNAYGAAVDASARGNPYAPFASKLDWEIARWGKLRGPGSTAFTEFLEIEEVSVEVHNHNIF